MISKISRIVLGIFSLFLVFVLFISSEGVGFVFLLITGVLALVVSVFLANDVKKLNNSLLSKILSIVLIDTALYSILLLFYGLSNIGVGDKGLLFLFILLSCLIFLVVSIIVGIVLIVRNKDNIYQGNPNKILSLILLLILITLLYTAIVPNVARISQNPWFCSLHIEIKDDSFIFRKGERDYCIQGVAIDTSNVNYCKQIKDSYVDLSNSVKNICILNVARDLGDKNICYQITNDDPRQGDCIRYIAENRSDLSMCETPGVDQGTCYVNIARGKKEDGNPEICNYIIDNATRYYCYSIIAIDKRDINICEKYFPSDEILISEGVNPSSYSKSKCARNAVAGFFND